MSLKYFLKSKKLYFSFSEIHKLLQLSEGYTRQVVADMVKRDFLIPDKRKKDKRFVVYSLNWVTIRNYLLSNPADLKDIILNMVDEQYQGQYVVLDNFEVIYHADTLSEITEFLSLEDSNSTKFVACVGSPKFPLIVEFE